MIEIAKALMFLLPFLRELFFGKASAENHAPPTTGIPMPPVPADKNLLLKKFLMYLAIASVLGNFFTVDRLFTVSGRLVESKKEVRELRAACKPGDLPAPVVPVPAKRLDPPKQPDVEAPPPQKTAPTKVRPVRPSVPSQDAQGVNDHRLEKIDAIR